MEKAKIRVKATCPSLAPKERASDMDILKAFYKAIDTRLIGIDADLAAAKCKKLVITIEAAEEDTNAD